MNFSNLSIVVVIVYLSIRFLHAFEQCSENRSCPDYCCKTRSSYRCCPDCPRSMSKNYNCPNPFLNFLIYVVAGIISSIIFIIVVVLIILISCGCICSSRTGIQRRGRILRAHNPAGTVINSEIMAKSEFVTPPYEVVYPPEPVPYQQEQLPYPPAYHEINTYKQLPVSVYPANQNQEAPPSYNKGFLPNHP